MLGLENKKKYKYLEKTVSKNVDDYYATKEECFAVAVERAAFARATPQIFFALPMCQEIILGEEI